MKIGDRSIGPGEPCFIVAEMGVNHNGSLDTALEMVRAAKEAGADAVKVQLFLADNFVSEHATYKGEKQTDLFRRYELPYRWLVRIAEECHKEDIIFFGTPDSVEHGRMLVELGAPVLKVGSDDFTNRDLVAELAALGKPLIISTGMAGWSEIVGFLALFSHRLPSDFALLHCSSLYPTPIEKARLGRLRNLLGRSSMASTIGYSDHTDGIMAAITAVAIGASIVEKHFTLDRSMPGPDHAFSADPKQFASMVSAIRAVESAMTDEDPGPEEMDMRKVARRSILSNRALKAGEVFKREDVCFKRPGTGLEPYRVGLIVGKRAARDIPAGAILRLQDVE